jgi:hypothetical protein
VLPRKRYSREREGRHRAEQQDEEQRYDGDDHRVLEVEEEIALLITVW